MNGVQRLVVLATMTVGALSAGAAAHASPDVGLDDIHPGPCPYAGCDIDLPQDPWADQQL